MGIRAMCAAAAVAMGIGSAADAATLRLEFDYAYHGGDNLENTDFTTVWGLPVGGVSEVQLDLDYPASNYAELKTNAGIVIFGDIVGFMNGVFWGDTGLSGIDYTVFSWDGTLGYVEYSGEFGSYETFKDIRATLSLVSDLAPVPLPAGALLLPAGIGALALLRKRRRSVS
ncbi:VPLPA-CTERM protein sorting domain-containing protein [Paracoccus sediminis]|nr:VPLPA-CTERM protein sorting domain-containing protein [Paracoccus sediminis]